MCGAVSFHDLYQVPDRHYGISGTYSIVQCRICSLVLLNPLPNEQALVGLYPKNYYSYQNFFENKSWLKQIVKRLCLLQIGTKDPHFSSPGRILDLGCGSGKFLYALREKGWETFGAEINADAAELGRRAANLNIFSGNLREANFPNDYFDYIRSNHSFEHVDNPNETLLELKRILKPEGKMMIGVPNFDSWNSWRFQQYWWYLGAPVHPFNYSMTTLCKMLEKHGFVVERKIYNSDYSGILGSLQIWANRNSGKISTEGALFHNFVLLVLAQRMAKLLDLLKQGDVIEITSRKSAEQRA